MVIVVTNRAEPTESQSTSSEMVEHLDREKDYYRDESQNRQTGNQQTQSRLSTLSAPGPARAFRKQIFAVPRILQDIRRI